MKRGFLVVLLLVLAACGQSRDFSQGKKIEAKISQYVEAGLDAKSKGFTLQLPYDPIGNNIEDLPDSNYKKALKKAWEDVAFYYNYEKAKKALNKAIQIRAGQ